MALKFEKEDKSKFLIILTASYLIISVISAFNLLGKISSNFWINGLLIAFIAVILHGYFRYGFKKFFILFSLTFFISWFFETLSILTGFPFGNYYYTDLLGFKLIYVPIVVNIAYFIVGYLSWTMGCIFLNELKENISKKHIFTLPLISSLIMLAWDLSMDPLKSTVRKYWIWEHGGAYFGVPLSNFFGWFFTMYIIFQIFTLIQYKTSNTKENNFGKSFWYVIPLIYGGISLDFLGSHGSEIEFNTTYISLLTITIFTMILISTLNIIHIKKIKNI